MSAPGPKRAGSPDGATASVVRYTPSRGSDLREVGRTVVASPAQDNRAPDIQQSHFAFAAVVRLEAVPKGDDPMNAPAEATPQQPRTRTLRRGVPLGRLFGIEIRFDWSVLIVFALIVSGLGSDAFPSWHPSWSRALIWSVALLAGLLFFVSLLVHELAHALVARRFGISVPRITLFLFGGAAEMESEPPTPMSELAVAIVGPIVSAVLGFAFTGLAIATTGAGSMDTLGAAPGGAGVQ